jgi:SAM-dependent methyltransferase
MVTKGADDSAATQAFADRVVNDLVSAMLISMCNLGDRLGLFDNLAKFGPATSAELAARSSLNERYLREWLSALSSAGYLVYDPSSARFAIPPEHIPVLADELAPQFQGGRFQYMLALFQIQDEITRAFRQGGGVSPQAYPQDFWDGSERTAPMWVEHRLIQHWIAAMPDVQAKLEQGIAVADIGCGQGGALIKLAQVYPNSTFTGYDIFEPSVAKAAARAETAGLSDRVRFEARDVVHGLPELYDFIMTHEVVHDAAVPLGMLQAIRNGLRAGGVYLMKEYNASDRLEQNGGLLGSFMYSISVLFCMTTSLSSGGLGLGAAGLPEIKVRELCAQAGFSSVQRLAVDEAFSALYAIRR